MGTSTIQSPVLTPSLGGMQRRQGGRQSFRIRKGKTGRKEDKAKGRKGRERERKETRGNGEGGDDERWCPSAHCSLKPMADWVACKALEVMDSLSH